MDLKKISVGDLELFLDMATKGSLREVARLRKVEAAQLSRSLQRLEKILNKKLFERSSQGLMLTAQGLVFRENVQKALSHLDFNNSNEKNLSAKGQTIDGIGASSFLMNSIVLPTIGKMHESNILTSTKVVELPFDRLIYSGLRGIVKVVFHVGKLEWPASWTSEKIGDIGWSLYGSRKFFQEAVFTEQEIAKEAFVYPLHWTPKGLREAEDQCPLPLSLRVKTIGVSAGWMSLQVLRSQRSVSYLPDTLIGTKEKNDFVKIEISGWPKVQRPIYVSAHIDAISQKTFNQIVKLGKEITNQR